MYRILPALVYLNVAIFPQYLYRACAGESRSCASDCSTHLLSRLNCKFFLFLKKKLLKTPWQTIQDWIWLLVPSRWLLQLKSNNSFELLYGTKILVSVYYCLLQRLNSASGYPCRHSKYSYPVLLFLCVSNVQLIQQWNRNIQWSNDFSLHLAAFPPDWICGWRTDPLRPCLKVALLYGQHLIHQCILSGSCDRQGDLPGCKDANITKERKKTHNG